MNGSRRLGAGGAGMDAATNERTRGYFEGCRGARAWPSNSPKSRRGIRAHLRVGGESGPYFRPALQAPAQQPVLIRLSSLFPPALWRTVFDPNEYNLKGTTAIDWYVPSPRVEWRLFACRRTAARKDAAFFRRGERPEAGR